MSAKLNNMAERFRALHTAGHSFLIPNAWNVGSARHLANLGFSAIATTSAGVAMDLGVGDGEAGKKRTLQVASDIVKAVDLPVTADLENCFSETPEGCAETVREAIGLGLAGGSIEDFTGDPDRPIYPFDEAVARVRAAVVAVRETNGGFVLTARAEGFVQGRPDLADTIARLKTFQDAGADVLFAPGLPDMEAIKAVRAALSKPINVLLSAKGDPTFRQLADVGVERVSTGPILPRMAESAFLELARALRRDMI